MIVDLRVPRALEALDALAADAAARVVPSVAFIDHERTDLMEEARAKGAGQVMAKGQFANALPKLLQAAMGPPPPAAAWAAAPVNFAAVVRLLTRHGFACPIARCGTL